MHIFARSPDSCSLESTPSVILRWQKPISYHGFVRQGEISWEILRTESEPIPHPEELELDELVGLSALCNPEQSRDDVCRGVAHVTQLLVIDEMGYVVRIA